MSSKHVTTSKSLIPYAHQLSLSDEAVELIKLYNIAYLACEERTGKTITALLVAKKLCMPALVVTKAKAVDDWKSVIANLADFDIACQVTSYHSAHKLLGAVSYKLVILDEAHNYISSYPKPGLIWKQLKPLCADKPILYISATPYAQGPQMLYHQFALSSWSPFKRFYDFYSWFKEFGIARLMIIQGREVKQYTEVKTNKVLELCKHLFITKTRKELGFDCEPTDKVHYIELDEVTKEVYNELVQHSIVELKAGWLVCDTPMKLRVALHQLEGGTIKLGNNRFVLANDEKVQFILAKFGDSADLVIMYNYKAELPKLQQYFKHAMLLQATSFAEGVDLSMYKHLVIYSQDFSTAKHTQRRARQANKERSEEIKVHFLLVKKAISEQVYKTVSINKINFVDSVFDRSSI